MKAAAIIDTASEEAERRLGESDSRISRQANEADSETGTRRKGADDYAREVLFNLEEHVAEVLGQVRKGIDVLDPVDAVNGR